MKIKVCIFGILILMACSQKDDDSVSPKPRMYPRIDFPEHHFITLDKTRDCGFSFRRSIHSEVVERDRFFDEQLDNNCWFDLNYPIFNATVHFTYHSIQESKDYASLASESFRMAYEHSSMASAIEEIPVIKEGVEQGMVFRLRGPVASPYQFYLTDTVQHFLRGSLYFNSHPNPDSIAPLLEHLSVDMDSLVQSIHWE